MIAFIDDHREVDGVELICRQLLIASSTYRLDAGRRAAPSTAQSHIQRDAWFRAEMRRVWDGNFQIYAVRKVGQQLRRDALRSPGAQSHG